MKLSIDASRFAETGFYSFTISEIKKIEHLRELQNDILPYLNRREDLMVWNKPNPEKSYQLSVFLSVRMHPCIHDKLKFFKWRTRFSEKFEERVQAIESNPSVASQSEPRV